MKNFLLFPFLLILISGCLKTKLFESIESTHTDGTARIVKYYKNESKKNLVKEVRYWENGNKSMEGSYKNGKRTGQWTAWYSDGEIWSTGEYKDGLEHGLKTVYHENGQKYYEGAIKNEKRKGAWQFWDKEGKLIKEINYDE